MLLLSSGSASSPPQQLMHTCMRIHKSSVWRVSNQSLPSCSRWEKMIPYYSPAAALAVSASAENQGRQTKEGG
jgi:hypothetical protein